MNVFNRYIVKNLLIATLFVMATLSAIIILTQSLRFLELIIDSGAGAGTFWTLTFLALPRFWEIIIPIAAMVATVFTYSRLKDYSELVILRSTGASPLKIARPALISAVMITSLLWVMTLWVTPKSLSGLQELRRLVKSQFSVSMLHEKVFNRLGKDFTVYINKRSADGTLHGLIIHDQSNRQPYPTTIVAERGILQEHEGDFKVIVYKGSHQSYNLKNQALQKLDFERYTVDLPLSNAINRRLKDADERTLQELISPEPSAKNNPKLMQSFRLEIHRRLATPLLAFTFIIIAASVFISGPTHRNPNNWRAGVAILSCITMQGLFIAAYNIAKNDYNAFIALYGVPLIPALFILFTMSHWGETFRRRVFYKAPQFHSSNTQSPAS